MLGNSYAKTLNVHGLRGDKILNPAHELSLATSVDTVDRHIIIQVGQDLPADRAGRGWHIRLSIRRPFLQNRFYHLRNHIPRSFDHDRVASADVSLSNIIKIVQTGIGDQGPTDLDRLQYGAWSDLARTSHGSTLSALVHGWVLARARRSEAWTFVQEALAGDIADLQGGTTGEGIHLGAMAGTLDLVQRGLTGLETRGDTLRLAPVPIPELSEYGFSIRYRGHWGVHLRLRSGQLHITVPDSDRDPITVALGDRTVPVAPGESRTLALPD